MSHRHLVQYIRTRNEVRNVKSKLKRCNRKMMDLVERLNQLREEQIKSLAELKRLRRSQKKAIAGLKRSKTITVQTLDDMHNARRLLARYNRGWDILVDAEDEETRFLVHIVQSVHNIEFQGGLPDIRDFSWWHSESDGSYDGHLDWHLGHV